MQARNQARGQGNTIQTVTEEGKAVEAAKWSVVASVSKGGMPVDQVDF